MAEKFFNKYSYRNKSRALFLLLQLVVLLFFIGSSSIYSFQDTRKNILIVVEGNTNLTSVPIATGRQLATLLGHFSTKFVLKGVSQYTPRELENYEYTFYIGDKFSNKVPTVFLNDVTSSKKQIIWLNTGMIDFSKTHDLKKIFGFYVSNVDSTTKFNIVKCGKKTFTKEDGTIEAIQIVDKKMVNVLATAYSTSKKKEVPYIIKSKNLTFIADSPFSYADETDRYLLFADMLHDILGEEHEESHSAIIRIEDISPMDNPDKLREIADLLSQRGIPFLVSVIPFYVNPGTGTRISLSEKPEMVDALKYMVKNGASLVMHGITHQYKGVTAADFEFWDVNTNKPIKNESEAAFSRKIEDGILELTKNGLYPVLWETPHYTGSFLLYKTISKYFSTAIEPRLAIENFEQSQYFPYIINKDLFGQKIIPENLGYVPFSDNKNISRDAVKRILAAAKTNLQVRDGFASCFFHEFLDLDLLTDIIDGVTALGYTYIDIKDQTNWVKLKDRAILTGDQQYSINLDDQYSVESYFDLKGELKQKNYSNARLSGKITKSVKLLEGELYFVEPAEFREQKLSFLDKLKHGVNNFYENIFSSAKSWKIARPVLLWNHFSRGALFNDQASFASAFKSVNIKLDTIFVGQKINLNKYNLVIVPLAMVDSLAENDKEMLLNFVKNGGNILLDSKSKLAEQFNIKFTRNQMRVNKIREKYFPEEPISWRYSELVSKFEIENNNEVLCSDEITKMPMVIGKPFGDGKVLYLNSLFDPHSQHGYSLYPYLLEYISRFLNLHPFVRRDNLEFFFDPGFRSTYSIESLVKQWVSQGIRIVHVAGWHQYPKYTYDYKRLIDLAHANGILIYAWIEPPQISQKFWNEHPEWREKNFRNEDVRPSWRYPVALTNSQCINAVNKEFKTFLERYDWDGVNLAELYFEAGEGFEEPNLFTPMNNSAVSEVQKLYGINLTKIFSPSSEFYWKHNQFVHKSIIDYRVNKLSELYELFLSTFQKIAEKKNGFEIIVTAMDSFGSPELRENIAVDMSRIIELQKKYKFRLQVEDPEKLWSTDPKRYVEIAKLYSSKLGGNEKLSLDLNIMSFRKENAITPFPTLIQTGIESFQLINSSALGAPRFTIYSESSVNPQDMAFFPFAAAANINYNFSEDGVETNSPTSFSLKLPQEIQMINLDGNTISASRNDCFVIPAGVHKIFYSIDKVTSFSTQTIGVKVISITGNLISVAYGMKDVKLAYESSTRTIITLNKIPTTVLIDGKLYSFNVLKGNECFSIFLPAGNHFAEITAGDSFSFGINITSLWSSTGIAIFGTIAVIMLVIMFVALKFIRTKYSITKK